MADEETPETEERAGEEPAAEEASGDDAGGGEVNEPEEPEEESAVAPEHEAVLDRLEQHLGDDVVAAASNHGNLVVRVTNAAWHRAGEVAQERLDCEYLSFISAIDWMPRPPAPTDDPDTPSLPAQPSAVTYGVTGSEGRFQLFACVESTDDAVDLVLKTDLDEDDPRVASWTDLYAGADWHERECWEMFGVVFEGHPHLRHLYLPREFEGRPLRKDFPLLSREVKPWPGLVDPEPMPEAGEGSGDGTEGSGGDDAGEARGESEGARAGAEGGEGE